MLRAEAEEFWSDVEKWINDDVDWAPVKGHIDAYGFDDIEVISDFPYEVLVDGLYNCRTGAVTFNFKVRDVGPITRYDAGGQSHRTAGRYHQHKLLTEECPRQNLPHADERQILEGKSAKQIWDVVCAEGKITHNGEFWEPEVKC